MKYYKAPWGGWLVSLSVLQTLLCLGAGGDAFLHRNWWLGLGLVALPMGCALFSIRGYTLTSEAVLIHRLLWVTRLPLAGLQSAKCLPGGVSWRGVRIGNGGFFSFTGWSYVPGRGLYRVFVTDPNQKVILHFPDRKVVLSPCAREEFIHDLPLASPEG